MVKRAKRNPKCVECWSVDPFKLLTRSDDKIWQVTSHRPEPKGSHPKATQRLCHKAHLGRNSTNSASLRCAQFLPRCWYRNESHPKPTGSGCWHNILSFSCWKTQQERLLMAADGCWLPGNGGMSRSHRNREDPLRLPRMYRNSAPGIAKHGQATHINIPNKSGYPLVN